MSMVYGHVSELDDVMKEFNEAIHVVIVDAYDYGW